ncbi:MAG: winged helix DNA-binding protein [Anaerolineales bacterium]|nr:winged helix DNA-binding protein [Anaerolineales bacterium]
MLTKQFSDIGNYLGVTNAAASQLIDRLVGMGLLEHAERPADRRVREVRLTPRGQALMEEDVHARPHSEPGGKLV